MGTRTQTYIHRYTYMHTYLHAFEHVDMYMYMICGLQLQLQKEVFCVCKLVCGVECVGSRVHSSWQKFMVKCTAEGAAVSAWPAESSTKQSRKSLKRRMLAKPSDRFRV